MKKKIFISHSGNWKDRYVYPLVERLGKDNVVVDKYNFESGEEIWDEIERNIEDCQFFVLLISKEAFIKGGWIDKEINKVRDLVDEDKVILWPVVIDEEVSWDDSNIKPWIKKNYITDQILSPKQLARLLNNKLRHSILESNPTLKYKRELFFGREEDMALLKGKYSDSRTSDRNIHPTTVFVSGLKHLGRKRFIKEFLVREVKQIKHVDDISNIFLESTDNGWKLLHQLNELIGEYAPDELNKRAENDKVINNLIVNMVRKLIDSKDLIVIEDDGAIVKRNGHIASWFKDLIEDKRLQNEIVWCVCCRFQPRFDISRIFPQIITLRLNAIQKDWLIRLFKEYARIIDVPTNDVLAEESAEIAKGFPQPIFMLVEALKDGNSQKSAYNRVSRFWDSQISDNYSSLIDDIRAENPAALPVLQILAKTPLLSIEDIREICGSEALDSLDLFETFGVIQYIGRGNNVVLLNPGLADFIRRKYSKLPEKTRRNFESFTKEQIENKSDSREFAGFLLALREQIRNNPQDIPEDALIPSLVLKLITEYYYQHDDDMVIQLADQILKGYKSKYKEMTRSLKYWLCSALCRKGDRRLLEEVKYFKPESYSYNFLMGFYHRHHIVKDMDRAYQFARDFYQNAYALTFSNDSEFDDAKLLHEMWIVKFHLREPDAGEFARKCYERRPTNHYHIEAYFRSEVRSPHPDKKLLSRLVKEMQTSSDSHKRIIAKTMEAELRYIGHLDIKMLESDISKIIESGIDDGFISYPIRIFREICEIRDSDPVYRNFKSRYPAVKEEALLHLPD